MRPSVSQARIVSAFAGPYWPPEGGRTYQTAAGASEMGSWAAAGGAGTGGIAGAATAVAVPAPLAATAVGIPAGAPEPLVSMTLGASSPAPSTSLSTRPASLTRGMRTLVPHLGQTPFLPARNALTF